MGPLMMPVLAIGQAVVGAVTAFATIGMARQQQKAANEAAARQLELQYKEIDRQQSEVNRIAQEQVSDRMRVANMELGTVRVAAMERGLSGYSMAMMARTIGYLEGVDLSRINKNRVANIEAGEAAKTSAKQGFINTVTIAANQAQAASTSAVLGMFGSGLQIAGGYYKDQQYLKSLQNKRA